MLRRSRLAHGKIRAAFVCGRNFAETAHLAPDHMMASRRTLSIMADVSGWHLYIIECSDGSFYTGITNNLARRLRLHNAGRAARYTRGRGPVTLRYCEPCASRAHALRREWAVKRLSRAQKNFLMQTALRSRRRRSD